MLPIWDFTKFYRKRKKDQMVFEKHQGNGVPPAFAKPGKYSVAFLYLLFSFFVNIIFRASYCS